MYIQNNSQRGAYEPEALCPDYREEGSGPPVILVHSSMAGARQWSTLMPELNKRWNVRAVNLFGYGATRAWSGLTPPSLDDFAKLVASAVPRSASKVALVGHSLGGAVVVRAATQHLRGRVGRLVLIEPSLFDLLEACGRYEAYDEILELAAETSELLARGALGPACERFIDYWCGPGFWSTSPLHRRGAIVRLIKHLPNEWNAVLARERGIDDLRANLPSRTLLMSFRQTVRPSREVVELLSDACLNWEVATIPEGGHMGPVTHPALVNPIIRGFLSSP